MKQRMLSQDIAKGIAILAVVQVHTLPLTRGIGSVLFILVSAMPFFLFMTGYNYRNKGTPPWQNMLQRVWMLLKTILIYSVCIFVVMGAYFLLRKEATVQELLRSYAAFLISKWGARMIGWDLPQVLFQRLLGPYWFLQFLTVASIVFYLTVDWALRSAKHLLSVLAALTMASFVLIELGVVLPWGVQNAPAIAAVMILAAWIHKNGNLFDRPSKRIWIWINSLIGIVIIALIELKWNGAGYLGAGALGEVIGGAEVYLLMLISVLGSYFLVSFSTLIEKVPVLSTVLIWFGRHTLQILCLHLSVMHIIKDILRLPQTNAAEKLFVDKVEPGNILAFFLTLAVTFGIVTLMDKIKSRAGKNA